MLLKGFQLPGIQPTAVIATVCVLVVHFRNNVYHFRYQFRSFRFGHFPVCLDRVAIAHVFEGKFRKLFIRHIRRVVIAVEGIVIGGKQFEVRLFSESLFRRAVLPRNLPVGTPTGIFPKREFHLRESCLTHGQDVRTPDIVQLSFGCLIFFTAPAFFPMQPFGFFLIRCDFGHQTFPFPA